MADTKHSLGDLDGKGNVFNGSAWVPLPDPLIEALVEVLMREAAPGGAVDFPRAAAAFAQLLAEMIGPQPYGVQQQILADFNDNLKRLVLVASLRATAAAGKGETETPS